MTTRGTGPIRDIIIPEEAYLYGRRFKSPHPSPRPQDALRDPPPKQRNGDSLSGRPSHVPMTSQRPSRFGWAHHSNQRAELERNNLAKGRITWSKMECSSRRLTLLPCPRHRRPKLGIPISEIVSSAAIRTPANHDIMLPTCLIGGNWHMSE